MPKIKADRIHDFIKPYVVTSGKHLRLKHYPGDTHHLKSEEITKDGVAMLAQLQNILYAQSNWGQTWYVRR
jgi:hypothetical protein